jgi:hypothetical protein
MNRKDGGRSRKGLRLGFGRGKGDIPDAGLFHDIEDVDDGLKVCF